MSSSALLSWKTVRRRRIDELLAAHAAVGGHARGRRTATNQLNRALSAQLSAEFQGFCRDLHDESIDFIIRTLAPANIALITVLQLEFSLNRNLDKGNPTAGNLGSDFKRFGIDLWDNIKLRPNGSKWNTSLEALIKARNGIAHSDNSKLRQVALDGFPMTLATVKRWKSTLNVLASAMDDILANQLSQYSGGKRPW